MERDVGPGNVTGKLRRYVARRATLCDAITAPTNGALGTCTSSLASGSTCLPTCNTGYTVSGSSSCLLGVLTAATCFSTVDCSSLNDTIVTQCSQGSVANVVLPQGLCPISSQIVIPNGCVVSISGTKGTNISGSNVTRHFNVPSTSTLILGSLTLKDGYAAQNGVRKHPPSLALTLK